MSSSPISAPDLTTLLPPYAAKARSAINHVEASAAAEERLLCELRLRNRALRAQVNGARDAARAAAQARTRVISTSGPDTVIVEDWRADDLAKRKRAMYNAVTSRCAVLEAEKEKLRGELRGYEMMAGPGGLTSGWDPRLPPTNPEEIDPAALALSLLSGAKPSPSASELPFSTLPPHKSGPLGPPTHTPPSLALGHDKESAEAAGLGAGINATLAKLRAASTLSRELRAQQERLEGASLGEDKRIAALVLVVEKKQRAWRNIALLAAEAEKAREAARCELALQRQAANDAAYRAVCEEEERVSMSRARVAHTEIAVARALARTTALADARCEGTRGLQNEGSIRKRLMESREATAAAQKTAEGARRKLETYAQVRGGARDVARSATAPSALTPPTPPPPRHGDN